MYILDLRLTISVTFQSRGPDKKLPDNIRTEIGDDNSLSKEQLEN
jgi:hypothetical protein